MQHSVIKYKSGDQIKKAFVKLQQGEVNIVIGVNLKVEYIQSADIIETISVPDKIRFKQWLQYNYTWHNLSDEWEREGKRYTECSLYIHYLLK